MFFLKDRKLLFHLIYVTHSLFKYKILSKMSCFMWNCPNIYPVQMYSLTLSRPLVRHRICTACYSNSQSTWLRVESTNQYTCTAVPPLCSTCRYAWLILSRCIHLHLAHLVYILNWPCTKNRGVARSFQCGEHVGPFWVQTRPFECQQCFKRV